MQLWEVVMENKVEEAKQRTKKALAELGASTTDLDLSYITSELLDFYEKNAKEKSGSPAKSSVGWPPNLPYTPRFCGHHLVHVNQNIWNYQNNNPTTNDDTENQKCSGSYAYRVGLNQLNQFPCPNNNPPGGFVGTT
jgi:hypothetical protein